MPDTRLPKQNVVFILLIRLSLLLASIHHFSFILNNSHRSACSNEGGRDFTEIKSWQTSTYVCPKTHVWGWQRSTHNYGGSNTSKSFGLERPRTYWNLWLLFRSTCNLKWWNQPVIQRACLKGENYRVTDFAWQPSGMPAKIKQGLKKERGYNQK